MARGVILGWFRWLGGADALSPDMDAYESISASSMMALIVVVDAFSVGLVVCVSE